MNIITILWSITIYYTNIYSVLAQQDTNYTQFIATVCNASNLYYDSCACDLATFTSTQNNDLKCFNTFNCPYNSDSNKFCSGNGYCNFSNGSCACDTGYGSDDCSQTYELFLPNKAILILMIVIASTLLLLSILLVIWVHLYRDVGDVKAMSVVFTHLTLVGCALICCGTIVMGMGFDNVNCVLLEWFHFLGICIVISCALLKSYRIASIFGQSNFSPSDLTDTVLLKYFLVMIIIDMFFLGIYTIFNFVEGGAYTRYIDHDNSLDKEVRCSSEPLTMLSYSLLVAWQLVLLLFVIKYGNQTRSASKIFKETKCIYIGSNIGSMFFIAFGIFVLFTEHYTLQIVIRGYGSLVVVMMVISLLFYPKFKTVYNLRFKHKSHGQQEIIDENGNIINEEQAALKRQYEAHVKEPNGKELLLLLDALVKEIAYRANMKMLSIELNSIDLKKCNNLLQDIKNLIPQPDESKNNNPDIKETIENNTVEKDIENNNDIKDTENETQGDKKHVNDVSLDDAKSNNRTLIKNDSVETESINNIQDVTKTKRDTIPIDVNEMMEIINDVDSDDGQTGD